MKPREILEMCQTGKFARKTSDTESTKITPEDLQALKEDAEYWCEHIPKVSTVNAALEYDMGPDVFDLLFDRGCVFEGRGVRYKMDRGLFQNYSAYGRRRCAGHRKVRRSRPELCKRLCKKERERMMRKATRIPTARPSFLRKYWLLEACIISATRLSNTQSGMRTLQGKWRKMKRAPEKGGAFKDRGSLRARTRRSRRAISLRLSSA
jgi:formate C-acetyltransferase